MNYETPEFLLWSIRQECPLREEIDENTGHKVLRHLRPLRAWSDSCEHHRIFEGICVQVSRNETLDPTVEQKGFRATEMFEYYGGHDFVRQQCAGCAANTHQTFFDQALAGCVGMVQVDATETLLPLLVEESIQDLKIESAIGECFLPTTPRWYGLWARSPLEGPQLELLDQVFSGIVPSQVAVELNRGNATRQALLEFQEAIGRAKTHQLQLDVELFPQGMTTPEKDWFVHAHCYDCKSPMDDTHRRCSVCGRVGGPHPKLRRRARGDRPYWPLSGFLGKAGAVDFLSRYRDANGLE